jgi:TonB family protein
MAAKKRRASRRNLAGLLITLGLHAGVLLTVAKAHNQQEQPLIMSHDYVVAEMVKLGKPRDKFWLPRITQPPRSTAPNTLKVSEDPNAAPSKEAPRPDDPKLSKDLRRALDRARKLEALAAPEEPDEGSLTGSKLGTSNRAIGDQYMASVIGTLKQNYNLPAGIAPDQINTPPEISFHIAPDGTLTDVRLIKPSGNSFVDDACVEAAKLTQKVPPPPSTIHGMRIQCVK